MFTVITTKTSAEMSGFFIAVQDEVAQPQDRVFIRKEIYKLFLCIMKMFVYLYCNHLTTFNYGTVL